MLNTLKLGQMNWLPNTQTTHKRAVNRVLWQILAINLVVSGAKLAAGLAAGSISMLADGFHSLMDASSNVAGLIGSTIAGHPPDDNHPYGHHKYEAFATLFIGGMLLFASANVLQSSVLHFFEGGHPQISAMSFGVIIASIILNIVVTLYESWEGKRLQSPILLADATHTRSDIFVSLSVLASLTLVHFGWAWADLGVALLIVVCIARAGFNIVRDASNVLSDCAVVDPRLVSDITLSVDGVQSCHKIRSRGTDRVAHLDLHIQVDGDMSLQQAHHLAHLAQHKLQEQLGIADVLVHVEPTH